MYKLMICTTLRSATEEIYCRMQNGNFRSGSSKKKETQKMPMHKLASRKENEKRKMSIDTLFMLSDEENGTKMGLRKLSKGFLATLSESHIFLQNVSK